MDLGVRGSQIIFEKLPIFKYEGYRVGSSRARGHTPWERYRNFLLTDAAEAPDFQRLVLGCIDEFLNFAFSSERSSTRSVKIHL